VHHGSLLKLEYPSTLVKYLGGYSIGQDVQYKNTYNQIVIMFSNKALPASVSVRPARISVKFP
jgi:hypothetical protein